LASANWQSSSLTSASIPDEVLRLKQRPGKNIGISDSATLTAWLLREGLLDQPDLLVFPVVGSWQAVVDRSRRPRQLAAV
jgi:dihydrofolate reductase